MGPDSRIHLVFQAHLFVRLGADDLGLYRARGSSYIADVKAEIARRYKVPADRQRLSFAGTELEDAKTLDDYSIARGATVDLVVRE